MAIVSSDIKRFLSGGSGNTDPNASLGGAISSTEIVDNTVNNLFASIGGSEASAGSTKYRGYFVKNNHGSLTAQNTYIYIKTNTPSTDTVVYIGIATETGSPMDTIVDEDTAPTGISFSLAATPGTALSIGSLAPGEVKGIWVKRVVTAGATAYNNDNVVIEVFLDTNA